jgi:hypothetical protein
VFARWLTSRCWTDDVPKLTTALAYLPDEARERERWLRNGEIEALFSHLAGHPSVEDYAWDQPPHPEWFLFAQVEFLGGPVSPGDWLKRICNDATSGTRPALIT